MPSTTAQKLPVTPKKTYWNPSAAELKAWTLQMANARKTNFGAANVQTRVLSRSKLSTFVVSDTPKNHSDQCISRKEYATWSKRQDDYIAQHEMIVIDGFIGNDPEFRVAARLIVEKANPNIAGMQQQLYYPLPAAEQASFEPEVTVIYTPNIKAEGYPDERLIAVDLENNITRVFNSDYFGESKKGGLRKWNKIVYDRGGLPMHAGAKIIPVKNKDRVGLIVGLSGTGKTTTTFTKQNNSQPVQDDFIALMPGGKVYATENGCFAKTFGLDPNFEPAIYKATNHAEAYLENVSQKNDGTVDYFDTSYTKNGRSTFTLAKVEGAGDARSIKKADFLLILNKNDNIIPAVARLTSAAQAAAYFMLGETMGTSAGGAAEEGKALRVPGTNPFFPLLHAWQGNRLAELIKQSPLEVYLLNTGRVGGSETRTGSKKVKIPHSSAIVKGIAEGTIKWKKDPDFGYEIATSIPEFPSEDNHLLSPRDLYESQGRLDEYKTMVSRLKADRVEYMKKWTGLDPAIVAALSV